MGWIAAVQRVTVKDMELLTDRLRLRPWHTEEAPRLLEILGHPDVVRWLGDEGGTPPMTSLGHARHAIERYADRSALPPLGVWAIEDRRTGAVAGTTLLQRLPHDTAGEVEVGWHLHPDSWGHGYAAEAAAAVLAYGFAHGLGEILAVTHPGNEPSMRVCERLGMRHQGVVERWYGGRSELFRITLSEWASHRRSQMSSADR